MKLALECPTPLIVNIQTYADFDFILTHLMDDPAYSFYYQRSKRFKILDNSTNELGTPCSIDTILKAAELVKPNFICPPDYLGDSEKTMMALEDMEVECSFRKPLLPILQADHSNLTESIDKFVSFIKNKGYHCVAIPYDIGNDRSVSPLEMGLMRSKVVAYIYNKFMWIHLLGCTTPDELKLYKEFPKVRSIDTGSPITNGLVGSRYGIQQPLSKSVMLDFDIAKLTDQQSIDILHNIAYLRKIISKEDLWLS